MLRVLFSFSLFVILNLDLTNCEIESKHSLGRKQRVNITTRNVFFNNDPQCDPNTSDVPCGSLIFVACTGVKTYFADPTLRMNWFEAWEYCRSHKMTLASIESRYEQTLIETFIPKPESPPANGLFVDKYWTSGSDMGREGLFFWMASGKSVAYTNWIRGQPDNNRGREHCIEMQMTGNSKFEWNDSECANTYCYILCQQENPIPNK